MSAESTWKTRIDKAIQEAIDTGVGTLAGDAYWEQHQKMMTFTPLVIAQMMNKKADMSMSNEDYAKWCLQMTAGMIRYLQLTIEEEDRLHDKGKAEKLALKAWVNYGDSLVPAKPAEVDASKIEFGEEVKRDAEWVDGDSLSAKAAARTAKKLAQAAKRKAKLETKVAATIDLDDEEVFPKLPESDSKAPGDSEAKKAARAAAEETLYERLMESKTYDEFPGYQAAQFLNLKPNCHHVYQRPQRRCINKETKKTATKAERETPDKVEWIEHRGECWYHLVDLDVNSLQAAREDKMVTSLRYDGFRAHVAKDGGSVKAMYMEEDTPEAEKFSMWLAKLEAWAAVAEEGLTTGKLANKMPVVRKWMGHMVTAPVAVDEAWERFCKEIARNATLADGAKTAVNRTVHSFAMGFFAVQKPGETNVDLYKRCIKASKYWHQDSAEALWAAFELTPIGKLKQKPRRTLGGDVAMGKSYLAMKAKPLAVKALAATESIVAGAIGKAKVATAAVATMVKEKAESLELDEVAEDLAEIRADPLLSFKGKLLAAVKRLNPLRNKQRKEKTIGYLNSYWGFVKSSPKRALGYAKTLKAYAWFVTKVSKTTKLPISGPRDKEPETTDESYWTMARNIACIPIYLAVRYLRWKDKVVLDSEDD